MEIDFFEKFKNELTDLSETIFLHSRTSASWNIEKIQKDAERIRNAQEQYKQKIHDDLRFATTE